ncbi:MAG: hypothetical protein OXI22_10975 [Defluviicoccus sp.]|nr:hypothetical protein [Defluviicoccus sp.]MDE2913176.1 hypothetical protein [Paracoccaceae bacterium]
MERDDFVLAAMAAIPGQAFSPVQVQKFFFLLDKKVSGFVGGPHFDFIPYDYGPFDKDVYRSLEILATNGLVRVLPANPARSREYMVTNEGLRVGATHLDTLDEAVQGYIRRLAEWVLSLSFSQLVSAIYKEFPDMRENSVFQE